MGCCTIHESFKKASKFFKIYSVEFCSVTPSVQFSSVQLLSCVWLFATPWITARQASLSITNSRSSLRLTSIKSVMPSSHLILCHPLLLLPPIPPSIRVFSKESTLRIKVLDFQLQHQSFQWTPRTDLPYCLQFKSEFGNKEFMIWATVSSRSCFCWLYRASPSLAVKNIINLWCPCVESSLVLEEGVCYDQCVLLAKLY